MNIFVTDPDPRKSAIMLDDIRVKHMPRESAEMITMFFNDMPNIKNNIIPVPYWQKADEGRNYDDMYSHPVSRWVRGSYENLYWTHQNMQEMILECVFRFGQYKNHGVLMINKYTHDFFKSMGRVPRYPKHFRDSSIFKVPHKNVFDNYKETMLHKWAYQDNNPTWTRRGTPDWYKQLDYDKEQQEIFIKSYNDLPF